MIDLLALYKLNVLHLHLTDDQSWRLPVGRSRGRHARAADYSAEDLRALAAYAADRFVTVVPEVDTPGHASAFVQDAPGAEHRPQPGRVRVPAGRPLRPCGSTRSCPRRSRWSRTCWPNVAEIFPSPYLHIGGDEPLRDAARPLRVLRAAGPGRPSARSVSVRWDGRSRRGPVCGADDIIQYWFAGAAPPPRCRPEIRAQPDADLASSRRDVETAVAASVPVIVSPLSHCYLDVPYAEPSADPAQADRQARVGLRLYSPSTVAESFGWEPAEALGPAGRPGRGGRSRDLGRDRLRLRRPVLSAIASPARRRPPGLERPAGRGLGRAPRSPRLARPPVGARRSGVLPHPHGRLALIKELLKRYSR